MKRQLLKNAYYKITFNHCNRVNDSDFVINSEGGIVRISCIDCPSNNSAVSPINLNRTTRRNIKKTVIAK